MGARKPRGQYHLVCSPGWRGGQGGHELAQIAPDLHQSLCPACLYGQVIRTRRNNYVIKVEGRAVIGAAWRFEEALFNS